MLLHHCSPFPLSRKAIHPPSAPVLLQNSFSEISPPSSLIRRRFRRECAASPGAEPEESLTGFLGQQVEELLKKEQNQGLLQDLEQASNRVNAARKALAEIELQEAEAARAKDLVLQLQSRQSEIAETERELFEAKKMVEEAERSLSASIDGRYENSAESEAVDFDLERIESVKVAVVSSIVGTLAAVPISAFQATSNIEFAAHLGIIFFSCALFGVTFRYAVRRDLDNSQLKTGVCAAFGFVKGLSALESSLRDVNSPGFNGTESLLKLAADGAVQVSESIFIFLFSAVALDFCFKTGVLSPFPVRK